MKITRVSTAVVQGLHWSTYVRVETDEGITGMGECVHVGFGVAEVVDEMGRLMIGEDPLRYEMIFEKLRRAYMFDGALDGSTITALSGIDIALLDLAGKALDLPVYQLIGGKFRDTVRLYADCHAGEGKTPEAAAEKAKEVVAQGFNAIKFDIDDMEDPNKLDPWNGSITRAELDRMVDMVAAVREAVGSRIDFAVDMHGRYDISAAIRVARALEPYDLFWLEEPVPPENIDALREVKRIAPMPICVGENLALRWGFRDLLEKQAADIIMPDIPRCCGLTEGKRIADLAAMYYVAFAPHNIAGPLGTIASGHGCVSVPNFLVLEWHWMEVPQWYEYVVTDRPLIRDGYLHLPEGPGLGVEVNYDALRKNIKPGTRFFGE